MNKVQQDFEKWLIESESSVSRLKFRYAPDVYDTLETHRMWNAYQAAHNAQQATIDRLMLEFCPGEMTNEQIDDWAKHQKKYIADWEKEV